MEYIEEIQEQGDSGWRSADENDNVKESLMNWRSLQILLSSDSGKNYPERETVHPGTYIGKGKIEEVRALIL